MESKVTWKRLAELIEDNSYQTWDEDGYGTGKKIEVADLIKAIEAEAEKEESNETD